MENQLQKLVDEKEEHEASVKEIKERSEDMYYKKIEIFKRTIKPIEDSKRLVIEERDIMKDKIEEAESKIEELDRQIED